MRKKRKIAIVCGALAIGGAEKMIGELVCNINRNKYDILLYCIGNPKKTEIEKTIRKAGIKICFCGIEGKVTIKKLFVFYRKLAGFRPDVIHTHISGLIYSLPYIMTHKVRHIHTLHTSPDLEFNKIIRKFMITRYKKGKSILVAVSKENRKLAKLKYGLRDKEVKCIDNGVDIDRFYRIDHKDIVFINVGRQDVNKNQQIIVEAFLKLTMNYSGIRLVLVGDGDQHAKLEEKIKKYGIENLVDMPGAVSNPEDYLAKADIYIQSSHTEGLPMAVIEAMASSLPVIASDVGGMRDIIKENGILVQDDSSVDLENAMIKLLTNNELRLKMGAESGKMAESFSSKKMARAYEGLYG